MDAIIIPAHFTRYITLPALLLLQGFYAVAQNVVFTAATSSGKMGLKDQIELSYTIRDAENLQTMNPGQFKDFKIVAGPFKQQSSSINISSGRTIQTTSITITYVIQPLRTGMLQIQPCIAKDAEGHNYQSNSLKVEVIPGSLAAAQNRQQAAQDPWDSDPFAALMRQQLQAQQNLRRQMMGARPSQRQQATAAPVTKADISKDLFIRVVLDKPAVHVGEQVTATYKLYSRVPM